ncbi:deoxyribose-phosphate aldolase [Bicyclus anynana]|uniref:deoxyribose-phosphate aldolase n=1 Tax=Bicyclus anynana TaxID=110368 RepID=A0A6J1NRZ4_BICAN|nr:deoxyribose-phosphate aldolase [Bicyclus anynana]XP_023947913.1 deoxyribose-phosphate aldolase [Bicyclus anynana]
MVRVIAESLDTTILNNVFVDKTNVEAQIERILQKYPVLESNSSNYMQWLLKAVTLIDLTTLSGDDTRSNVTRLCVKAANPLAYMDKSAKIRTAAVCVYPSRVSDAHNAIKRMGLTAEIQVAAVATGFPSGQYPIHTRLQEIKYATEMGATEIDVVLDRSLVLMGKWDTLYKEVVQMKAMCGAAHLKVILGVGELGTYENVYKASMVSMLAGADFIKTSTGKEAVNATLPVGLVMCRAIRNYYKMTGTKVGLKPAGGIKTSRDAVNWLVLVHTELGPEWLTPELFRIGASSLLDVLEKDIKDIYIKGTLTFRV